MTVGLIRYPASGVQQRNKRHYHNDASGHFYDCAVDQPNPSDKS